MMIQTVHKGRTVKDVTFLDAANDSDLDLANAAISAARESIGSLSGWFVQRYADGGAIVHLYID